MESTNLLNPIKNISLFYPIIDEKIFKDQKFIELMNILIQKDNITRYTYALYTDTFLLRTNLFIPAFNTLYLSCNNNNVILNNDEDIWLTKLFTNNNYFILKENTNTETNYNDHNIKIINLVKDVL